MHLKGIHMQTSCVHFRSTNSQLVYLESTKMKLTDQFATTVEPGKKIDFYRDSQAIGLALQVTSKGKKNWIFEAKIHGKTVRRVLSDIRAMKCAEARAMAREVYAEMRQGVDRFENYKLAMRREKLDKLEQVRLSKVPRLEDNIDHYLNKNSHLKEGTIRFYTELKEQELQPYLHIELNRLTQSALETMYDEIASRKTAIRATKAVKFVQTLCRYFDFPVPAIKTKMEMPKPRQARLEPHHGQLIWNRFVDRKSQRNAILGAFLLMTGVRIGEALRLRKKDVDMIEQTAMLINTKNGRHHKIYISDELKQLIYPNWAAAHPDGFFLKLMSGAKFHHGLMSVPYFSAHDLRKLFTITASDLGIAYPVIKAAVNHVSGDITLMHYLHATPKQLRHCFDTVGKYYASQEIRTDSDSRGESVGEVSTGLAHAHS